MNYLRMSTGVAGLTVCLIVLLSCQSPSDGVAPGETITATSIDANDADAGGETTVYNATSRAFSLPLATIRAATLSDHIAGDAVFGATFVAPPAEINPGLGPLFNNVSCTSCHQNDGRAQPPLNGEPFNGLLFRISVPGTDAHGGPLSAPGFGLQVQTRAVFGVRPEMDVQITYTDKAVRFADGETITLRQPTYTVVNPYRPLPAGAVISPRIAQPNFGLGLLEAIPESLIVGLADEADANGDGISGKANYVWDDRRGKLALGRFGWKASQPTLIQQGAAAAEGDMGITSTYYPVESSFGQEQDVPAHAPELTESELNYLKVYLQTLSVPARRNLSDPVATLGKALFVKAGCGSCHIPKLHTGPAELPELSNQTIRPYTDLLLHDMGEALADNRPDYRATGREWRTAPLWGIGLTNIVNGHTAFLHDGRARSLLEAILWHGGEAEAAGQAVRKMSRTERSALIKFLESL